MSDMLIVALSTVLSFVSHRFQLDRQLQKCDKETMYKWRHYQLIQSCCPFELPCA